MTCSKNLSSVLSRLAALAALALVISASSCKSAPKKDGDGGPSPVANTQTNDDSGTDSDRGGAMGIQSIHFPYDSFVLTSEAKSALNSNVQIMKSHPGVKVQIEGHCDSRGGIQYNIALGEKRANTAKKYVEDQGIAADRVTTISYGKEKPIDNGTTEDAYAKNRRDNFMVTAK